MIGAKCKTDGSSSRQTASTCSITNYLENVRAITILLCLDSTFYPRNTVVYKRAAMGCGATATPCSVTRFGEIFCRFSTFVVKKSMLYHTCYIKCRLAVCVMYVRSHR